MNLPEFKELQHLAEIGEVNAMYELAKIYRFGRVYDSLTVPKNKENAKKLLMVAANKGHKPALKFLNSFDKKREGIFGVLERFSLVIVELFKAFIELLSSFILYILLLTVFALIGLIFWYGIKGLANIPVSIAIIIGAIIIAIALALRK